jgi:hypothetical protein
VHQHIALADVVGVEVLDLEVVDSGWAFQKLVLDLLNYDDLAVD